MGKLNFAKSRMGGDHHHFKDHQGEAQIFRVRVVVSLVLLVGLIVLIVFRFYELQIKSFERYSTQAESNRIQVRPIPPNRGLISDIDGEILADNRAVQTLSLTKERIKNLDATIEKISELVEVTERDIENFHKALAWRRRPYEAVPLVYNLNETELALIAVNEYALAGVEVQGQLVRHYPFRELFTHVAGYVGRINQSEQEAFSREQEALYSGTQSIGKIGLEKQYEGLLLGGVGQERIETDARGRVLRVVDSIPPTAGQNIQLFLDKDLQQKAVELMAGRRGAVVAIDIKSGGVLTMLSSPSYDPNLFVTGISNKEYRALNESRDLPLFNRAIQGQYPPGSTVKPMLGMAGLESAVTSAQSYVSDPGYYQLENDERLYREWKRGGHGAKIGIYQAIVESCDVFFYDLGFRMGVDQMHAFGLYFGLGQKTNIDIPSERRGIWPSREWKKSVRGQAWYPGNSLNMSIGQGDVLTTPLQLAAMTATLANRGVYVEPRLVSKIGDVDTEKVTRSIYFGERENWELVLRSMHDVVHSYKGTAHSINKNIKFKMAGKTGTAQVVSIAQDEEYDSEALSERNRDHALFVGFAPYEKPEIAVAVVIENGEKSSRAGSVARDIIGEYLAEKMREQ